MNTPAHSGWIVHGAALLLGAGVSWLAVSYGGLFDGCGCAFPRKADFEYPLAGYFDNYTQHPRLAAALQRTFEEGSSIVLLGSSELTTADHPSKPANFFNQQLNVPLLALGHAGNQSFSMHAQLISAGADLGRAKLAILVSPSWFVDRSGLRGTELATFLEYQPSPSLYRVQQRVEADDPVVRPVAAFMAEHEHELGSAQPVAQWITRDASVTGRWLYTFSQPWNAAIIHATRAGMLQDPVFDTVSAPPRQDLAPSTWDSLYARAVQDHLAQCTNNKVFVYDAYYAEHVQGKTRQLEPHAPEENREMHDFIALLDYLKDRHAKPYLILQPLNPYVYTNLKDVDPTMDRIRQELDARDFTYLDLWIDDTADFQPGVLTDVMHLGPLGWYRIDRALAAYFP
ncbi:MAG: hypothetical protein KA791_15420 [Flavobacteriales bacterium]|nr:hypothetical protein [Flavobacteriales bacterium]